MQRVILSCAAIRLDLKVLPVPKSLRKAAAAIALSIKPLLSRGLIGEIQAGPDDVVWREDPVSGRIALIITPAGMEAIGVSSDGEGDAGSGEMQPAASSTNPSPFAPTAGPSSCGSRLPRDGSKLALLIATLSRSSGATIPEIIEATGWQAHSIRGAISGALKKKLGLTIVSEPVEGRGRVYRISASEPALVGAAADTSQVDAPITAALDAGTAADDASTDPLQPTETTAAGAL
jgi:hypothetical protein